MFPNFDQNPILYDNKTDSYTPFAQTIESMIDAEQYSRFIYGAETQFRKCRFYKDYKSHIYDLGFTHDQLMRGITMEMAGLELHHHLPTLKDAAICITEYCLRQYGKVTTFDVTNLLIECHRRNFMGVCMMTTTNHQKFHDDPTSFISVSQLIGYPFNFIDSFGPYATIPILMDWLLQMKREMQHQNQTYWPLIARARDEIMNWSQYGNIRYL